MPHCPNPRCRMNYPSGTTQCSNPFCQCLLPEAVVAGRYRVETLIGMGGMGAVYRVSDTFEMAQVALKVLSVTNNNIDLATAVERFRREARYAHQLHHKNIVPVLNFGQDGQLLYLVMPLVTGGTLRSLLKAEQPLPLPVVQRYLNDLADAIDAIHKHPQQVIHRDIKPSNLLIHQEDGRLVVADFGIARAMQQEKALTRRGIAVGTEHYLAPEQEMGHAEARSDIYSMGIVVYQMLTGLLPYQALIKSQGRVSDIPGPSMFNSSLPKAADAVVLRAINIEPKERFHSAHAFAEAFNDALTHTTVPKSYDTESMTLFDNDNVMVRAIIPENPCSVCGGENRSNSHFCRYCGNDLSKETPLPTSLCQVGYKTDMGLHTQKNEDMLLVMQGLCTHPQFLVSPSRPASAGNQAQTAGSVANAGDAASALQPFSLLAIADGLREKDEIKARGAEASRLSIETVADVLLPLLIRTAHSSSSPTPSYNNQAVPKTPPLVQHTASVGPIARRQAAFEVMLEQWVRDAVHQANRVIYHCNADYDTHMGSTLTVALLYAYRLYVASVGDSRAYLYNAHKGLQRITTDHTLAASLVEAHLLEPQELYDSPKRHEHYRYLGQNYQVDIDLFQREVEAGDIVLLCTDGLWSVVHEEDMVALLAHESGDPQKLAQEFVDAAKDAGSTGNSSAIVAIVK